MVKFGIIALGFLAICHAQAPQPGGPVGQVAGQVVGITGEKVRNATLRLRAIQNAPPSSQAPPTANVYSTTSDAAGNFVFESAAAGRYSLSAQRTGYLALSYDSVIAVGAGQPVTGISLKMIPEGRIEGKITNEDGDPVPGARVLVSSWASALGGFKILAEMGSGSPTADDGTFVIGGLRASHYYVTAEMDPRATTPRGRPVARESVVATYYPGVLELSSATLLKVDAGAVIRSVDIQLKKTALYSLRGRAIDGTTNSPAANVGFSMYSGQSRTSSNGARTQEDGSFLVTGLMPGTYAVRTMPTAPGRGVQAFAPLYASQPITIGKEDVEDVIVRLSPGVEIAGKITTEGAGAQPQAAEPAAPSPRLGFTLSSAGPFGVAPSQPQRSGDGVIVIHNVPPAEYFPSVPALPPGTYLKTVRLGNQDVTDKLIDLTSGVGGTLEFVLSPHAADVSGVLRNSNGDPLPEIQVTLWRPGERTGGGYFLASSVRTDPSGTFHLTNLAPGEYRVAAWEGPGALIVPEFLDQFDSAAASVRVDADSHQIVEAPLIKQDAIDTALGNVR